MSRLFTKRSTREEGIMETGMVHWQLQYIDPGCGRKSCGINNYDGSTNIAHTLTGPSVQME